MKVKPPEINQKDAAEAFDFMRRIDFILRTIREQKKGIVSTISEEEKKNATAIIRVEFPKEGGVLSHLKGEKYPIKGFPYGETIAIIDGIKRIVMMLLKGMEEILVENKIKAFLLIVLFEGQITKIILRCLQGLSKSLDTVRQKPEMYCRCVRELYRASGKVINEETDEKTKEILTNSRDIVCMILEYDDAYRYPFQKTIAKLNKPALKDVVREIGRLFDIAIEEETREAVREKVKRLKRFLFVLRFNRNLREVFKKFLSEINIDEMVMDEADKHHASFKGIKVYEENKGEVDKNT